MHDLPTANEIGHPQVETGQTVVRNEMEDGSTERYFKFQIRPDRTARNN